MKTTAAPVIIGALGLVKRGTVDPRQSQQNRATDDHPLLT